jgi:hypothetical protein
MVVVKNFGSLTVVGIETRDTTYIPGRKNKSEGAPKENENFGSPPEN